MYRPLVRLALAIVLAWAALSLLLPSLGLAAALQLLVNPGFNDPASYVDTGRDWSYNGVTYDEKVANGWWYYYVPENTKNGFSGASKLHWMSSQQFKQAFGGLDYYREGNAAQVIWSSYEFDAGIYQQVGGLSGGAGLRLRGRHGFLLARLWLSQDGRQDQEVPGHRPLRRYVAYVHQRYLGLGQLRLDRQNVAIYGNGRHRPGYRP